MMTENKVKMGEKTSALKKRKHVENKAEQKLKRKKKQLMKKKLIIRNLSFKVSKDELKKIFSAFGEVLNVEIPETKEGRKKGFAFIQFKDTNAQVKAMKELNFKQIHGRPISIDFCVDKTTYQTKTVNKNSSAMSSNLNEESHDDEVNDSEDDSKANSKSERLDESNDGSASEDEGTDDKKVNDFLKEFDADEERQDTDDVSDETDDETESSKSDEAMDDNSSVKSEQYKKKRPEDVSQGKTVFIRNISFKNTQEDLQDVVEEYGAIDYCLFCKDHFTDQFKGSAFVKFKEKESADKMIQESYQEPGILLDGRKLFCVYALSRDDVSKQNNVSDKVKDKRNLRLLKCGLIMRDSQEAEGVSQTDMSKRAQLEMVKKRKLTNVNFFVSDKRLAVHNLPKNINDKDLKDLFRRAAGKTAVIKEARVMKDFKQTDAQGFPISKGFGFVSFTEHEDALKAMMELNNNPKTFSSNKRPIVEFSIENKTALLSQEKRREKLKFREKKKSEAQPETEKKAEIFTLKNKHLRGQNKHPRGQNKHPRGHQRHPRGKKEKRIHTDAQERRNLSALSNKYKKKLLNKIKN